MALMVGSFNAEQLPFYIKVKRYLKRTFYFLLNVYFKGVYEPLLDYQLIRSPSCADVSRYISKLEPKLRVLIFYCLWINFQPTLCLMVKANRYHNKNSVVQDER